MAPCFANFFKFFSIFFKKTLKFPKTLPIPITRYAEKRLVAVKKSANIFKLFSLEP